jgi:hypothetical protein
MFTKTQILAFNLAVQKLQSFNSADALAEFLGFEGITGSRWEQFSCPIAQYIERQIPNMTDMYSVGVKMNAVVLFYFGPPHKKSNRIHLSSGHVGNFIYQFDRGGYPFLNEKIQAGK